MRGGVGGRLARLIRPIRGGNRIRVRRNGAVADRIGGHHGVGIRIPAGYGIIHISGVQRRPGDRNRRVRGKVRIARQRVANNARAVIFRHVPSHRHRSASSGGGRFRLARRVRQIRGGNRRRGRRSGAGAGGISRRHGVGIRITAFHGIIHISGVRRRTGDGYGRIKLRIPRQSISGNTRAVVIRRAPSHRNAIMRVGGGGRSARRVRRRRGLRFDHRRMNGERRIGGGQAQAIGRAAGDAAADRVRAGLARRRVGGENLRIAGEIIRAVIAGVGQLMRAQLRRKFRCAVDAPFKLQRRRRGRVRGRQRQRRQDNHIGIQRIGFGGRCQPQHIRDARARRRRLGMHPFAFGQIPGAVMRLQGIGGKDAQGFINVLNRRQILPSQSHMAVGREGVAQPRRGIARLRLPGIRGGAIADAVARRYGVEINRAGAQPGVGVSQSGGRIHSKCFFKGAAAQAAHEVVRNRAAVGGRRLPHHRNRVLLHINESRRVRRVRPRGYSHLHNRGLAVRRSRRGGNNLRAIKAGGQGFALFKGGVAVAEMGDGYGVRSRRFGGPLVRDVGAGQIAAGLRATAAGCDRPQPQIHRQHKIFGVGKSHLRSELFFAVGQFQLGRMRRRINGGAHYV